MTLYVPKPVMQFLTAEASIHSPAETGGVILGYQSSKNDTIIVHAVGPGPRAIHDRWGYSPDQEFHEAEIARLYREASVQLEYLGDWHTHPGGTGTLSGKDRRTLRRIATYRPARSPHPIMLILHPGPVWHLIAWQAELRRDWLRRHRLSVQELDVMLANTATDSSSD